MCYTISNGTKAGALEVMFDKKPGVEMREALKSLKFRWNSKKGVWYGFASLEELSKALKCDSLEQKPEEPAKCTPIKFYYNGIKINNSNELIKCYYFVREGEVSIVSKGYGSTLPHDLFDVKNDTDLYTDYFDTDGAIIKEEHPLYRFALYNALKADYRTYSSYLYYLAKNNRNGLYNNEIERTTAKKKRFEKMENPGQPTNADLLKIDAENTRRANEERARKHEEELAEREHYLNIRNNGREMIKKQVEAFPLDEKGAFCEVIWSEHPAFNAYNEAILLESGAIKLGEETPSDCHLKFSISAIDNILKILDSWHHEQGYYKTKFNITVPNPDNTSDPYNYEGRYDIGDGDGGIIKHIRDYGEWYRTHDARTGQPIEAPEATNDTIEFAKMLETA